MAKKKICLDPGHYGSYYNAGAVKGYYESAVMFKLTMYEKEYLEQMGIQVVLTRTDINSDPELTARGRMAKGCDLFVSNHSNATGNPAVNRAVGLHMVSRADKSIDDTSKDFALKLAKVVANTMGVDGYQCYSVMSENDRDGDGVKNDNYYGVLHGAFTVGVPGIIIEHSFHTNANTCKWLMNDANLRKLAKVCAECMAAYVGASTTPSAPAAPATRDYLMKGDKGAEVKEMQGDLIKLGYSCGKHGADGDFGNDTDKAVKAFQKANGLTVDGLYGPKSKAKAKELLAKASKPATPEKFKVKFKEDMNVRTGAGTKYPAVNLCKKNYIYTIVDTTKVGTALWGKLLSGAGWVCIAAKYCDRV